MMIYHFLWKGRLEKLPLDELYAPRPMGGLGLPCVSSKCESLLLTHTVRVMVAPSNSAKRHFSYWLGLPLRKFFPGLAAGPNAEILSEYFKIISELCRTTFEDSDLLDSLPNLKCKKIYAELTNSLPPPKIERKFPHRQWKIAWKNINNPVLSPECKDILFSVIHNIFPTNDRLARMNMHQTGNCSFCPAGVTDTVRHKFTDCILTAAVWNFLIQKVKQFFPTCDSESLFYCDFKSSKFIREILFLVGNYFLYCNENFKRQVAPSIDKYKIFLRNKLERHYTLNLQPLVNIWV